MNDSVSMFAEGVWDEVVQRLGPIGDDARQAHHELIGRLRDDGFSARQAGLVVAELVETARASFGTALQAFEELGRVVQFMGVLVEEGHRATEAMSRLLEAKASMAELYHHVATLASAADIAGVASVEETAQLLTEAREEVVRWYQYLEQIANDAEAG
jgi:hypothetical protein